MNEIIRVLVVLFLALSMTNCAQRNVERNYGADVPRKQPTWKSSKKLVREGPVETPKIIAEPRGTLTQEDVTGSATIDSTLELSAEQDPENQTLKRKIQMCTGC